MDLRELSPTSLTAADEPARETVEVFTRRGASARWELCSEVEVPAPAADLTVWLSKWLDDNGIDAGQWLAGNKWSGQDSVILSAAPSRTVAA